jgi:hydrogenase-4 component E
MTNVADSLLIVVLLLNFFALGTSRIKALVTASAAQGMALGLIALLAHGTFAFQPLLIAAVTLLLKGIVIPQMLLRALRDVGISREVEPLVGLIPSLLLCALGTGLAVLFAHALPLAKAHEGSLLVPTSLSTVFSGFLLLTTRRKAISQVVGYLVLENGVFIMGLTLVHAMPFLVEMGVLLDLLVAIFVMGIIINHIKREFASLDTTRLSQLRD